MGDNGGNAAEKEVLRVIDRKFLNKNLYNLDFIP
jgi:hypothetical protein